jgi:hypothetical protein
MEYYKFQGIAGTKYLVILGHRDFRLYNENMELEKKYKFNNYARETFIEKSVLVTDENELAKLMLICHI